VAVTKGVKPSRIPNPKARPAPPPPPSKRNLYIGIAAGVVLLAAIAYFIFRDSDTPGVVQLRSPKPEAALQTPAFTWKPYKGVSDYELEIVTESGEPVFATGTKETSMQVPADRFHAGQKYLWLVRALVQGEAKAVSHIDRFTYQP